MASGFALRRNGSCLATETECGRTADPYHACCPLGSSCTHSYNTDCCPTAANCTQTLLLDPQCANAEWDLFDNNGYFCCLRGLAGYATPRNTDGCAEAGYKFQDGEQLLRTISTGRVTSTITSLRESATSSSRNPSTTEIAETSSSPASTTSAAPKTGVIVGGSVGAVLSIAILALAGWLLVRWKRRRQFQDNRLEGAPRAELDHARPRGSAIQEKDSRDCVLEMPAKIVHEKDSRSISELPVAGPTEMAA